MTNNQGQLMTKSEIADLLEVSISDICMWAQAFADWLDVCPEWMDRTHDEDDILIFTLISELNSQIEDDVPFNQRIRFIKHRLRSLPRAVSIGQRRTVEKTRPEVIRWQLVGSVDVCLKYEYEWLKPLRAHVESIADFGCWATGGFTCSEPYALLWTLEAARVVVIDKNLEYVRNAQEWLQNTRERHPYFEDYDLEFIVGDMTGRIDALDESAFDLAFCKRVLYQIFLTDLEGVQGKINSQNIEKALQKVLEAINQMVRVTKPGGRVIAVESIAVNPGDDLIPIGRLFKRAGLRKEQLENAPEDAYCYRKPRK